jgi:hypothetical protein
MATILAGPRVSEDLPGQICQAESIIKVPKGEQTGVGRELGTVELQLEAVIEDDPEGGCFWFTHRTVHWEPRAYRLLPWSVSRNLACGPLDRVPFWEMRA